MVNLYVMCSVLMAALFVTSIFVHFYDQDWYFWIPLYVGAAYVNLMNIVGTVSYKTATNVGNFIHCLGQGVLSTVFLDGGFVGLLTMNMTEKTARGMVGAALVIVCMSLQISAAKQFAEEPAKKVNKEVASNTKKGLAILVGIGYSLSVAVFLMYYQEDNKLRTMFSSV